MSIVESQNDGASSEMVGTEPPALKLIFALCTEIVAAALEVESSRGFAAHEG
jgi:hypothetical protein